MGALVLVRGKVWVGDLKIPARVSQAQLGLRCDLGMVRGVHDEH